MIYILVIWMYGGSGSSPVIADRFDTLVGCEMAGKAWDNSMPEGYRKFLHHACLPRQQAQDQNQRAHDQATAPTAQGRHFCADGAGCAPLANQIRSFVLVDGTVCIRETADGKLGSLCESTSDIVKEWKEWEGKQ